MGASSGVVEYSLELGRILFSTYRALVCLDPAIQRASYFSNETFSLRLRNKPGPRNGTAVLPRMVSEYIEDEN